MKQVLVPKYFFGSGKTTQFSTDVTHANPIAFVDLTDLETCLGSAPTKDFAIMYRSGKTQAPMTIDIDYNSLTIVKGVGEQDSACSYLFTCPTGEAGKTYTINIVKRGVTKHERNLWRISITLKNDCTSDEMSHMFVAEYNKLKKGDMGVYNDVSISRSGSGVVDVTINYSRSQYSIQLTDELSGISITADPYAPGTLTIEDLNNLISEGIAGRGVHHRYEEGTTIYPFIEQLDASKTYVLYTLRFAVPRKASKTRDEVTSQLVHLIVDTTLTGLTTLLDAIKAPADEDDNT